MHNFYGVVESVSDPLKLGRVRVRVISKHSESLVNIPTNDLPWSTVAQSTNSPAISGLGETPFIVNGSHVYGFFRDGPSGQDLVVTHTIPGIPETVSNPTKGFNDPSGFYPKKDLLNESDINRLARNENIDDTIVQSKRDTIVTDIDVGHAVFNEPQTEYNTTYPYNKVFESESGHITEIDDTPNFERLHRFHKSGTFEEVYPDGKRVIRIVGEDYEIINDNKNVFIRGNLNVRVDGNVNLKIYGSANTEINGNETKTVNGDYELNVMGSIKQYSSGDVEFSSGGDISIATSSNVNIDGSNFFWDYGKATITNPKEAPFVSNSAIDYILSFDTDELPFVNDDNSYPVSVLVAKGIVGAATIEDEFEPNVVDSVLDELLCGILTNDLDYDAPISDSYKLKDLSTNAVVSKYTIKPQHGLDNKAIACNLTMLAQSIVDPIKKKYSNVIVTSGFRVGNTGSKHEFGVAVDLQFTGASKDEYFEIAKWISENLPIDALLLEYKNYGTKLPWIHVSYQNGKNRGITQTYFNNRKVSNKLSKLNY